MLQILKGLVLGSVCLSLAACAASDASLQTAAINVVEPGDNALGCPELKQQIASLDAKIAELRQATNNSSVNDALASSVSSTAVSQAYAGPNAQIFGPLQSALASVGSASRQNSMSGLHENLTSAKIRRDNLTGLHNQRCF